MKAAVRRYWRRAKEFVEYRVLHVDDTPHRLALGIAIGFFVAWTPTLGFHMILGALLAGLARANARMAMLAVWVVNPVTLAPVYLGNYWVGHVLWGQFAGRSAPEAERLRAMLEGLGGAREVLTRMFEASFWREFFETMLYLGAELWLGSVVMGLLVGVVSYMVSYKGIVWHRRGHPRALGPTDGREKG